MSKTGKQYRTETICYIRDGMSGEELKKFVDKATSAPYLEATVNLICGNDDNYHSDEYELEAQRLETDEELAKRLSDEQKRKEAEKKRLEAKKSKLDAQREEKDRKLFEQLKKKFMPSEDSGP